MQPAVTRTTRLGPSSQAAAAYGPTVTHYTASNLQRAAAHAGSDLCVKTAVSATLCEQVC